VGFKEMIVGKKDFCIDCGVKIGVGGIGGVWEDTPDKLKVVEFKDGFRCGDCAKKHKNKK
jgi:hypothetical protein